MQESPAIWQPKRRDLESFFFFFSLFTPPPSPPPNGERSFSPLLLNLRVGRDARPRGRPHRSHQNATTHRGFLPDDLCMGIALRTSLFERNTLFLRGTVNAVRAVETSGSRNVGMEGADFDSPSPTGVWSPTSRVWDLREWNFVALGYRYTLSGRYYKVGNGNHLAVPATWPRLLMRPPSRKTETPIGRG